MAAENRRKPLGKGLSALLGENDEDYGESGRLGPKMVPIELLAPSPLQPRRHMDPEDLQQLAQSVGEKGILQPLLVRQDAQDPTMFEIIAGERRWRAAQIAGLFNVPVVVKILTDREALEIALVENLQRENLSPLEEALGYSRLMSEFSHTQDDLAKQLGKSRSHVANMVRLLSLPAEVKQLVDIGTLSAGHARALLGTANPAQLAQRVAKQGLNVRQTERLARAEGRVRAQPRKPKEKDADTLALERDLSNLLGLAVEMRIHRGGGSLTLQYRSLEQLDDILHRLTHTSGKPADAMVSDQAKLGFSAGGREPVPHREEDEEEAEEADGEGEPDALAAGHR